MDRIFVSSTVDGAVHPHRLRTMRGPLEVLIPAEDPFAALVNAFCQRQGWSCEIIERVHVGGVELPVCPPFVFVEHLTVMEETATATVYEARRSSDVIVLKRLPIQSEPMHPLQYLLSAREMKVLTEIRSPWLVPVVGVGVTSTDLWIAMERMDGTLHDRGDGLASPDIIRVLVDTCRGLRDLHEQGWIHMDVKPRNIFIHQNRGRLGDLSAIWPRGWALPLTVRALTRRYADPVLLRADMPNVCAAPAHDVYSMGVVIRDLVYRGKLPDAAMAIAHRCTGEHRPSVVELIEALEACLHVGRYPGRRVGTQH